MMKNIVLVLSALPILLLPGAAHARSHAHYAYQGGHYAAAHGSSHKGGHYRNARTGNHYTIIIMARALILVLIACVTLSVAKPAQPANITRALRDSDKNEVGILVEGEIEPGDAYRLWIELLNDFGFGRDIYLRSKGGDVDEAIKMGELIRRLRLATYAPLVKDDGTHYDWIKIASEDNNICASACFLVYAGGVNRMGNYIGLHRPFLPKNIGSSIPDDQYERGETEYIDKITAYLKKMEIDQFFIDNLISNSSVDMHVVTEEEAETHHLYDTAPSIEEAIYAKCNVMSKQDEYSLIAKLPEAADRESIMSKLDAGAKCQAEALSDIQEAAFLRECKAFSKR